MARCLFPLLLLAATVPATVAADEQHVPAVAEFVESTIRPCTSDPIIGKAVEIQNRVTVSLDATAIRTLDQT